MILLTALICLLNAIHVGQESKQIAVTNDVSVISLRQHCDTLLFEKRDLNNASLLLFQQHLPKVLYLDMHARSYQISEGDAVIYIQAINREEHDKLKYFIRLHSKLDLEHFYLKLKVLDLNFKFQVLLFEGQPMSGLQSYRGTFKCLSILFLGFVVGLQLWQYLSEWLQ